MGRRDQPGGGRTRRFFGRTQGSEEEPEKASAERAETTVVASPPSREAAARWVANDARQPAPAATLEAARDAPSNGVSLEQKRSRGSWLANGEQASGEQPPASEDGGTTRWLVGGTAAQASEADRAADAGRW